MDQVSSKLTQISSTIPDCSRESKKWFEWNPSRSLLASIRSYQNGPNYASIVRPIIKKIAVLRHRFWSVVTGADIPINCQIGGGLLIPHPNGIVIHPDAVIGPNCLIFQQVTIGHRSGGVPRIEGHVDIGAGAKILGKVHIGADVVIGANSVVLIDVPSSSTAVGVPAIILTNRV